MAPHDERQKSADGPLIIWRFLDGKPGHEAQTLGLIEALKRRIEVELFSLPALSKWAALRYGSIGRNSGLDSLPAPGLIVGAGHATHLSILAARRRCGGRAIVLMKPSLPTSLFDLCLIPEHDRPKLADNVIETLGVLNPVLASAEADVKKGLFLIGGPSEHFGWDSAALIESLHAIVMRSPEIEWILTSSRRTPEAFWGELESINEPNLKMIPYAETDAGWVAESLDQSKWVWVTEDSVSMVYEALSAGARVGLLPVPAKGKTSRVQVSIDSLREKGWIVRYPDMLTGESEFGAPILREADRCAEIILKRYQLLDGEG
ncbi:MAG: mitochondrial fission ELM1 family protein [Verrucomicrobiota bacterium]